MLRAAIVYGTGPGFELCQAIRTEVFGAASCDECDAIALHVLVFERQESGETPVATGRLYPTDEGWRIGEVAVLPRYRGQGVGDMAVRMLLFRATQTYAEAMICAYLPQEAVPFAEKYGFKSVGGWQNGLIKMCMPGGDVRLDCGGRP